MPCFERRVSSMSHEPRTISFLGREGVTKHYGIATHEPEPREALVSALRGLVEPGVPGFTIAHDARTAGLGLVYWWANENELHARFYASPLDDPGNLAPYQGAGMSCVWELEVIDFERRAWLEDVLIDGDVDAEVARQLRARRRRPVLEGFEQPQHAVGLRHLRTEYALFSP